MAKTRKIRKAEQPKNCAGCGQCPSSAEEIQHRILEREVDEELRQERLAAWWRKYRFFVLGGAICVIIGTVVGEWYSAWQAKIRMAESDQFEKATVLAAEGQTDEALAGLSALAQEGKTGYKYLAQLAQAGVLLQNKRVTEGLAILKSVATDSAVPTPLRHAAIISYVGNQAETGNTAELQQMLAPIAAKPTDAFYGQAVELDALLSALSGQTEKAIQSLDNALAIQTISPMVRERLSTLKDMIQK